MIFIGRDTQDTRSNIRVYNMVLPNRETVRWWPFERSVSRNKKDNNFEL